MHNIEKRLIMKNILITLLFIIQASCSSDSSITPTPARKSIVLSAIEFPQKATWRAIAVENGYIYASDPKSQSSHLVKYDENGEIKRVDDNTIIYSVATTRDGVVVLGNTSLELRVISYYDHDLNLVSRMSDADYFNTPFSMRDDVDKFGAFSVHSDSCDHQFESEFEGLPQRIIKHDNTGRLYIFQQNGILVLAL